MLSAHKKNNYFAKLRKNVEKQKNYFVLNHRHGRGRPRQRDFFILLFFTFLHWHGSQTRASGNIV